MDLRSRCTCFGQTKPADGNVVVFTDSSDKNVATMARNLLHGRTTKLSVNDSVSSRSAFITQHVHLCPLEKQKTSKVIACVDWLLCSVLFMNA